MGFISMMLVCDANVIIEYDRRSSGLFSAALDMEHDNRKRAIFP